MTNHFDKITSSIASEVTKDNKTYLYFGGTAYLAAPQSTQLQALYVEGIKRFGINNGTSRGNNVQLSIYGQAEEYIANKYRSEAALLSSSGYLAVSLTVRTLSKDKEIRYAPDCHPALWLAGLPKVSNDFETWKEEIVLEINQSNQKEWLLLSNSLNNLFPEIYDFSFVDKIDKNKQVVFIIDDSHGIGILNDGNSILSALPQLPNIRWVVAASMAKALGVDAGVVMADKIIIEQLKQSNEFYGASPPAPAALYAFMNSCSYFKQAYHDLQERISYFASHLKNQSSWQFAPNFPVFLSKIDNIEQVLLANNMLISSFPYPDKNGKPLNRVVISAWHTTSQLDSLLTVLNNIEIINRP